MTEVFVGNIFRKGTWHESVVEKKKRNRLFLREGQYGYNQTNHTDVIVSPLRDIDYMASLKCIPEKRFPKLDVDILNFS